MMPVLLSIRQDGHHAFIYGKNFEGVLPVIPRDVGSPNGRNAPKPA